MSTLFFLLGRENPWPGLVAASLNLIVALSLVGLSLLLGVTISLLAWLHAFVDRGTAPINRKASTKLVESHSTLPPIRIVSELKAPGATASMHPRTYQ
jgi:hypothetical protein